MPKRDAMSWTSWEQQRWLRNQESLQKKLDCLMSLPRPVTGYPLRGK